MRVFPIAVLKLIATLLLLPNVATAGTPYVGFSFGTSLETHAFDVWNGANLIGRRALSARSASSDQAIAVGMRDAFTLGARAFDVELELFERRNARFSAKGPRGSYPTQIKTNSVLASVWTRIGQHQDWSLSIGAGVGARLSRYRMQGVGLNIKATDRAPYAMVGLRLMHKISDRVSVFGEWRAHTRPPVKLHSAGRAFTGPLEHNSKGQTLRLGLQIDLGR